MIIKIKNFLLLSAFLLLGSSVFPQYGFDFKKKNDTRDKVRFDFVKNLIIVPVEINGVELSFLLDTGVEKTILFSLENRDSLELRQISTIRLRGLGQGKTFLAYKSNNNHFVLGDAVCEQLPIYIIFNKGINFSPRLGIPVHGIIGYDFFKNFVVEVDYQREFIKFYDPAVYDKKCRKCDQERLYFYNNKPYLKTRVTFSDTTMSHTLLLDSGASDALWLFPNDEVEVPSKYFDDFLGYGLSGIIHGKRSKISSFYFGKYEFENITTAFPDSSALGAFDKKILKDGLIGSEIFKRFDLVINYPNEKILFRPNRFFDAPFYYNMSGLIIRYKGLQVVKEYEYVKVGMFDDGTRLDPTNNFKPTSYKVKFSLQPQLEIIQVRAGSPAEKAGIKKGDILLEVNGREAHNYTLSELSGLFSSEEGKKIKIEVRRNGVELTHKFRLQKKL